MQGKIRKIWENQTNGQTYWVLNIDGKRYGVWNPEYMTGLKEGAFVEYEFQQKGKYTNITSIAPGQHRRPANGQSNGEPDGDYSAIDRDGRIVRMSVLRTAAGLFQTSDLPWEDKYKFTMDMAQKFEGYVIGAQSKPVDAPPARDNGQAQPPQNASPATATPSAKQGVPPRQAQRPPQPNGSRGNSSPQSSTSSPGRPTAPTQR